MHRLIAWLESILDWPPASPPPDDQNVYRRREADLQRRFERLSDEVKVIQRTDTKEDG